jgi:hypothetical protein
MDEKKTIERMVVPNDILKPALSILDSFVLEFPAIPDAAERRIVAAEKRADEAVKREAEIRARYYRLLRLIWTMSLQPEL